MKAALILLLIAPLAHAQEKQEPAKPPEQQAAPAPARPLILRIDQLPPAERASITPHETMAPKSDGGLPDLGGKPSTTYDARGTVGSGTAAPGSPFPKDTQTGTGR
jgi:hypothetical protein